jgi:hypothetical protein
MSFQTMEQSLIISFFCLQVIPLRATYYSTLFHQCRCDLFPYLLERI